MASERERAKEEYLVVREQALKMDKKVSIAKMLSDILYMLCGGVIIAAFITLFSMWTQLTGGQAVYFHTKLIPRLCEITDHFGGYLLKIPFANTVNLRGFSIFHSVFYCGDTKLTDTASRAKAFSGAALTVTDGAVLLKTDVTYLPRHIITASV